jgi:hypothetical protein
VSSGDRRPGEAIYRQPFRHCQPFVPERIRVKPVPGLWGNHASALVSTYDAALFPYPPALGPLCLATVYSRAGSNPRQREPTRAACPHQDANGAPSGGNVAQVRFLPGASTALIERNPERRPSLDRGIRGGRAQAFTGDNVHFGDWRCSLHRSRPDDDVRRSDDQRRAARLFKGGPMSLVRNGTPT